MNVLAAKQSKLGSLYNGLHDRTKQALPDIMAKLNSVLDFDGQLLGYFVREYPHAIQLAEPLSFQQVKQLLEFYCSNLQQIQQASIDREESTLDSLVPVAEGNSNYKANRYNIGRFLREKTDHYQQCLKRHCKMYNGQQGLSAESILPFLKELFSAAGFQLNVESGRSEPFFSSQLSKQSISHLLEDYCTKVKMLSKQSSSEVWIPEQEVLDLIECWIRLDKRLVTSYQPRKSRKESRQQPISGAFQEPDTNYIPQHITADAQTGNSEKMQLSQNSQHIGSTALESADHAKSPGRAVSEVQRSIRETIVKYESMLKRNPTESQQLIIANTLAILNRQLKQLEHDNKQDGQQSAILTSTKKMPHSGNHHANSQALVHSPEVYQSKLEQIFYIYCRKRYTSSKHTTFDDIEHQTRTMNFEKFYNICHDFGLVQQADREDLRWAFKKHAKNLSEIDYIRFQKILADAFSDQPKKKEQFERRICHFKNDWSLSKQNSKQEEINYSFKIIPHSGKTEDEIRDQLEHRRKTKSTAREQHQINKVKMEVRYLKKMGLNKQAVDVINRINKKSSPAFNLDYLIPPEKEPQKLTITNLDKFKDKHFNPRTFVDDREDQYLKDYRLPEISKTRGLARGISQTKVRDLDYSERSRQQSIIEGIDRTIQHQVKRGMRVVQRARNQ